MNTMNATASRAGRRWPTGTEYAEAVQQPQLSFSDPELSAGQLTLTPLGIPAMASGQNAVAFHFQAHTRPIAVRCLLSENEDGRERYRALQKHLAEAPIPSVVPAQWIDEGVRVHASWWPVVVMPWVSGRPLHDAVEDRLDDPGRLTLLADRWFDLVESLQAKQFAHGDLQHGNVLLTDDDDFQLVDLDGIWVPGMTVGAPGELGHPNYQHARRNSSNWGPNVDTFSALAIGLSMAALGNDPSLARFMTGENLLFARSDFEQPESAPIWTELAASTDPEVLDLTHRLRSMALEAEPAGIGLRDALAGGATIVRAAPPQPSQMSPVGLPGATSAGANWWETPSDTAAASAGTSYWAAPVEPASTGTAAGSEAVPAQRDESTHSTVDAGRAKGLARLTGRPVVAGLVGGGVAGVVGSYVAVALQAAWGNPEVDAAMFVGSISAFLGGFVAAWPSLNLKAYGAAFARFLLGFIAGLVAGLIAVGIADTVMGQVLTDSTETDVGLVVYLWALTAALIGLAVGMLRSPKAAALGFTGGALAGAVGGAVHGSTIAEFDSGVLVIDATDLSTMLIAVGISMFVGLTVAIALRSARNGSFTVIEGPGQGSIVDFHRKKATIGGALGDTLVLARSDVPAAAVTIRLTGSGAEALAAIPVQLDGELQSETFSIEPEQVLGINDVYVRVSYKKDSVAS